MNDLFNTASNNASRPNSSNTLANSLNQDNRLHEIDWLRALAFILLIFYHIGMFYVADWQWHVKSNYQSSTLQYLMLMINPWRMPLIFFVSGFSLALVAEKLRPGQLLKTRFIRLFIPLVFASNIIIIPQPYFEAVQHYGYSDGFWVFAIEYLNPATELLPEMHHGSLGLYTWNHLWYLIYLLFYTLAFLLLKPLLNRLIKVLENNRVAPILYLLVFALVITFIELLLEPLYPTTHALIDDWYNHARYFLLLLSGYFVAKLPTLYHSIVTHLRYWLLAIAPMTMISLALHKTNIFIISTAIERFIATYGLVLSALCCLFASVALCGHYLKHSNPTLRYLNEAVLPWYILHQTVTIVLAVFLSSFHLGGVFESLALIITTFLVCASLYELIRRFKLTRFLFGMKLHPKQASNR